MTDAQSLVKLLLRLADSEGITLGKTKLVKLLYLLEVEYYRAHRERLTTLKWAFLHYGPYTTELESLLDSPDINVIPERLRDGRSRERVTVAEPVCQDYGITSDVIRLAKSVMQRWGGFGLESLLDYVYFETEPMYSAKRGQELDFTGIRLSTDASTTVIKLDRARLTEIRRRAAKHLKELRRPSAEPTWNPLLSEAMRIWDEESNSVRLKGEVTIAPTDIRKG